MHRAGDALAFSLKGNLCFANTLWLIVTANLNFQFVKLHSYKTWVG